jgi:hypothetical protein
MVSLHIYWSHNRKQKPTLNTINSCKPQLANGILTEEGMREALEGKLLISILAGTTISQLKSWVPPSTRVVRAMPNTPCKVGFLASFFVQFPDDDPADPRRHDYHYTTFPFFPLCHTRQEYPDTTLQSDRETPFLG